MNNVKIKLFYMGGFTTPYNAIEKEVNTFLQNVNVIDIKITDNGELMVIYTEEVK